MKNLVILLMLFLMPIKSLHYTVPGNTLIGTWKLYEIFDDPGDGSGKWVKVSMTIRKYMRFEKDGQIKGNYFIAATNYKIKDHSILAIIYKKKIEDYNYQINGNTLSITPVISKEGWGRKFIRAE